MFEPPQTTPLGTPLFRPEHSVAETERFPSSGEKRKVALHSRCAAFRPHCIGVTVFACSMQCLPLSDLVIEDFLPKRFDQIARS